MTPKHHPENKEPLFVPKRFGFGIGINWYNPVGQVITIGILLAVAAAVIVALVQSR
ncbi:DUF5808 domain-containing protein [Schleiferilactobacillus shenzhenensis]|uniref:DUF5808 domain-containing protein n=1 Tax=Schleiferilactobacillus shenzhenensis LY-73 TaxID=1231336 RepID=U4TKR5_9LACO|nr:DUF5808 domain-containing protein [Schleiferilactobacillus shenzhenensis]ERL65436.1 hypothetical protein L248_2835 [Schleiferilactobacillus shenzhenensis LY-73]